MNFDEIDEKIESWKQERRRSRKADKPLRAQCAEEIRQYILEVLIRANKQSIEARKYGLKTFEWFSVGEMAEMLRQTSKSYTGTLFHEFSKSDQCMIIKNALEYLWRKDLVERAIGIALGRECKQYKAKGSSET